MMTLVARAMEVTAAVVLVVSAAAGCGKADRPRGREPDPTRDRECRDPARPKAYFYPAEDRTHYAPDDPRKDGCELLVPDHLFCCPHPGKPTEVKP